MPTSPALPKSMKKSCRAGTRSTSSRCGSCRRRCSPSRSSTSRGKLPCRSTQTSLASTPHSRQSQTEVGNMQSQLAEKTTLLAEARLQEQEFKEKIHSLQDQVNVYEKRMALPFGASYTGAHGSHDLSGEPTEFEYLRKVLFEYMMGRETKTLAKVITTVLKFTPEHSQKVMEREEARATFAVYPR
ncbi:golgin subfamily A member 4-like isoform X1 [Lampetra fluviatilis]